MKRLVEFLAAIALVTAVGCTVVRQQKAMPPRSDDLHFHNLQVLPQNISHDELILTMRHFKQALGVECTHCHAAKPGDPKELDYPSDAKQEKTSARIMLRMTGRINKDFVAKVPDVYTNASCWTCHRGKTQPDIVPSLPPEEPR
jgi:hypothetical protein